MPILLCRVGCLVAACGREVAISGGRGFFHLSVHTTDRQAPRLWPPSARRQQTRRRFTLRRFPASQSRNKHADDDPSSLILTAISTDYGPGLWSTPKEVVNGRSRGTRLSTRHSAPLNSPWKPGVKKGQSRALVQAKPKPLTS